MTIENGQLAHRRISVIAIRPREEDDIVSIAHLKRAVGIIIGGKDEKEDNRDNLFISAILEDDEKKARFSLNREHRSSDDHVEQDAEVINQNRAWTRNKNGQDYFLSLLTIIYALIIISFSLVIELSPTWSNSDNAAETIFYGWMYGLGSLFILYTYLFMVYPQWWNALVSALFKRRILKSRNRFLIAQVSHNGEGCGTLYLRLGAVLFGCLSIVLFGLEIFLCAREEDCKHRFLIEHCLLIIFVALQMHFIFCNTKMSVTSSRWVCKLGFMHLVAVNLWTWIRFSKTQKKLKKKLAYAIEHDMEEEPAESSSSASSESVETSDDEEDVLTTVVGILDQLPTGTVSNMSDVHSITLANVSEVVKNTNTSRTLVSQDYIGDIASILTTCLVEYALIGAAVMFVLWTSIDGHDNRALERMRRKSKMRIDCTATSVGIFVGVFVLILSCISMGINAVYSQLHEDQTARTSTAIFFLIVYLISIAGTLIALFRMRKMQYRESMHGESLDQILMIVGMISEFLYGACEIDLFLTGRGKAGYTSEGDDTMPVFIFIIFIIRYVQVVLQSAFILLSFRLSAVNTREQKRMAGRQMVTYLLVANVSLFAFHIYEGVATSIGYDGPDQSSYEIIIFAVTPVIAFYRFHSSVCLAEIWKHSYSTKSH
ncbi:hypothetical protein PMAYCL1PPCAC_01126, partial [Pristionchus mayeri]